MQTHSSMPKVYCVHEIGERADCFCICNWRSPFLGLKHFTWLDKDATCFMLEISFPYSISGCGNESLFDAVFVNAACILGVVTYRVTRSYYHNIYTIGILWLLTFSQFEPKLFVQSALRPILLTSIYGLMAMLISCRQVLSFSYSYTLSFLLEVQTQAWLQSWQKISKSFCASVHSSSLPFGPRKEWENVKKYSLAHLIPKPALRVLTWSRKDSNLFWMTASSRAVLIFTVWPQEMSDQKCTKHSAANFCLALPLQFLNWMNGASSRNIPLFLYLYTIQTYLL